MSEELRPCPFCGGKAITATFLDYDDLEYMPLDTIEPEVTCENERCINGWWLSPNDWNTRPIEDALRARIAELEAKNEKINYFFRRLRMFCIFAQWDNPNTEAEFYKVDAEIREYLSEYKVCIDPEVQE